MRGLIALVFVTAFVATMVAEVASQSSQRAVAQSVSITAGSSSTEPQQVAALKFPQLQSSSDDGSTLELDRASDGQFYADVRINGSIVRMMIDTGASGIALSRDDARSAGLATSIGMNDVIGEGADGAVRGEYVKLDRVELGPLSVSGLDAVVLNTGQQSLLGQSFLSKYSSVHIEGNRMVLR